ncbi:MAG: hypothetical protein EXR07_03610 [Acetobacteraceae bacterium]|nr:hypothetical protein [Acetobacteraceae bacterium]
MALTPHFIQTTGAPALQGAGDGVFACPCGQSVLIAGYQPRNFLNIAIQCAICGEVTETPGVAPGTAPPPAVTIVERGTENPPGPLSGDAVLCSREEIDRLATLYLPRKTDDLTYLISDALLDEIEAEQRHLTGAALDPSPHAEGLRGFKEHPLAWAVAHFRDRLRDPDWVTFADSPDMVAMAVIASYRDLIASWGHHPLFRAMLGTVAAQGYSFHAMAMFGAAKALSLAGNRVGFVATEAISPRIVAMRLALGGPDDMSVAVRRFDRFEWPDGAPAEPQLVRAAVLDAMAASQGHINRLRPGMLILSGGAAEGMFDQLLIDTIGAALTSHGKRYRGLSAMGAIFPKVVPTMYPREARFGYAFYPAANPGLAPGHSVQIGTRAT